jgi:Trk K+ transport system NAD-binding subunit|tara:strand:+ start:4089 stop:5789 length:1701 start_codon:yes stop_codon:yes gene_type:complete
MKFFPAIFSQFIESHTHRRNLMVLVRLLGLLFVLLIAFSVIFHLLMMREGQSFSWFTGFYWALTVMSTLGFGDITFHTDIGRFFSMVVLATGMVFVLVLLPFTFIQFFYAPWMEAQQAAATPRKLPEGTRNHVVLTNWDKVTSNLVKKLPAYRYEYVVIVPTLEQARELTDLGIRVVLGDLDDPNTYRAVQLEHAAMLAVTGSDTSNTNVAFTAREIAPDLKIVTTARRSASCEVLQLSGVDEVIQLPEIMGQSLARRCSVGRQAVSFIGQIDELHVAEAPVGHTDLVGQTLIGSDIRKETGLNAIGVWERGRFEPAMADTKLTANTVLVLAGSKEQMAAFDRRYALEVEAAPIVIIGAGRVGRAAARALAARGLEYRLIEQLGERIRDPERYIMGDASRREVMEAAGIDKAPAAIITTHDDDTNVYLTIFLRCLRPDIQLIARSNLERNVSTLHRAGADFVMSYSSMGANGILNSLRGGKLVMVTEGLGLFKVAVASSLVGLSLIEAKIRIETGCSVAGLRRAGKTLVNPSPTTVFEAGDELIAIGGVEDERSFLKKYPPPEHVG